MIYERYLKEYASLFRNTDRDMWNYEDGCVLIGMLAMYDATGDDFYFNALKIFTDRYIEQDGTIRKYDMEEYNIDFIPAGRVLFSLYEKTKEEKYRIAIETLQNQLRNQPRTETKSFWHKAIYPNQVWLDGLYMGLPYYMQYENEYGEGNYEDIVLQFRNARKYLYDSKTHLYYHAWSEKRDIFWANSETGLSLNFWTRAIGWYLMALADVYELLPNTKVAYKKEIADLWVEAMDGMLEWKDKNSNMFYQLTALHNEEGNYLETSGSLMVAYSLLKGARLGVFENESYRRQGESILIGVELLNFTIEGDKVSLGGICKGAGLGPEGNFKRNGTVAYYLSEEVVKDEQKGVGVCMMAYAEYILAKDANVLAKDFPKVKVFDKMYDAILPSDPNFKP